MAELRGGFVGVVGGAHANARIPTTQIDKREYTLFFMLYLSFHIPPCIAIPRNHNLRSNI
jgi:hypothetical protein